MRGLSAFACFGIGAALLIAAFSAFQRRRRFIRLAKPCVGRVLSVERMVERSGPDSRSAVYLMRVAYEAEAQPYTAALIFPARPKHRPGDETALLYDAEEPGHIMPASGEGDTKNTLGLTLLALAFAALGVWLVL